MVVLINPTPSPGPAFVGTFFGGSSTRTAGTNGNFDWTLPRAGSVGLPPQITLYADPGYANVAVGPIAAIATADPTIWAVPYPATLASGAYWAEGQVTWYGGITPIPYRGHVLILGTNPTDLTPPPWSPTPADIAVLVPHRTMDDTGNKMYAFSATTRPPVSFVQAHIDAATARERAHFGDIGGRAGQLIKDATAYLAVSNLELALQPSTDVGTDNRDDNSIKAWYDRYQTSHKEAEAAIRSGIIGSPRRPGALGDYSPGYAPLRGSRGRW